MGVMEWFNSQPVRQFRQRILGDTTLTACARCTRDEQYGNNSRRFKGNQKSVIFTKTAFAPSWQQSPGRTHFEHSINYDGATTSYPIDLHIDLGNYCNLACKMCGASASSTIASKKSDGELRLAGLFWDKTGLAIRQYGTISNSSYWIFPD
jgi:hypothetical protein